MNETTIYTSSIGELIEPEPIAYSFNTLGWYVVLGLLVLIVLIIAALQYRKYRKNAYRREAISEVELLVQQKNIRSVFEINKLLKRISLGLYGRKAVASLYGLEWFNFLVSTLHKQSTASTENFDLFVKALYDSSYKLTETEVNELKEFAIFWIKNHRINV